MNGNSNVGCKMHLIHPRPLYYYALNLCLNLCAYITLHQILLGILFITSFSNTNSSAASSDDEPFFADTINNVTVPVGREATFQCVVHNLKKGYQVAWFHKDKHTLLALQDNVILRSGRHSVSNHAGTTFYLHIHDIKEEDRGAYMCQINTPNMKSQVGYLQIVVPPKFVEELTSSDTEVKEDSTVSLRCIAKGAPSPNVKWRREDGQSINTHLPGKTSSSNSNNSNNNSGNQVSTINGEYLNITKVTRLHMGAYICIATNGIPPAVSKRIYLGVNFSPLVWTSNPLIGTPIGSDVALVCNMESHPHPKIQWTRSNGQVILSSTKYITKLFNSPNNPYKSEMVLKIRDVKPADFDTYSCLAKNTYGEAQGSIRLFETAKPSTFSEVVSFATMKDNSNGKRKYYQGTRSSIGFDDPNEHQKPVHLTEVFGYEITSEHITLQSEEKATINSYNQDNGTNELKKDNFTLLILFIFAYLICN